MKAAHKRLLMQIAEAVSRTRPAGAEFTVFHNCDFDVKSEAEITQARKEGRSITHVHFFDDCGRWLAVVDYSPEQPWVKWARDEDAPMTSAYYLQDGRLMEKRVSLSLVDRASSATYPLPGQHADIAEEA